MIDMQRIGLCPWAIALTFCLSACMPPSGGGGSSTDDAVNGGPSAMDDTAEGNTPNAPESGGAMAPGVPGEMPPPGTPGTPGGGEGTPPAMPTPDPPADPTPTPSPDPEPQPEPDPDPQPEPEPDPQPEPEPDPDPGPAPNPDPEPQPQPDPGPNQARLGAACANDRDCDGGRCFDAFPGGYCSWYCENSVDCGPGGGCWNVGEARSVCLRTCDRDDQCRVDEGYTCDDDNTCFPGAPPQPPANPGELAPEGARAQIGELVRDFSLTHCASGEAVSFQSHFEGSRAAMFVLTAGWCPACAQWVPQLLDLLQNPQAEGLQVAFVLGENANRHQPTLRECQQYGRNANIPEALLFMDHNGQDAFMTVFTYLDPYLAEDGRFGLPWNAVLRSANWEYMYADGAMVNDLNAILSELL